MYWVENLSFDTLGESRREYGLKGLEYIRSASLYMIIAFILINVGSIVVTLSVLASHLVKTPGMGYGGEVPDITSVSASLMFSIILAIIGLVIGLIAIYGKLLPGASRLAKYSDRYSTASSLIKIGFIGVIVLIIFFVMMAAFLTLNPLYIYTWFIVVLLMMLVGVVLVLIGIIGIAVLSFKLNEEFNEATLLAAGIMFILGIFVSFLFIIGWILLYVGTGSAIRKFTAKMGEEGLQGYREELPPPPPL